MQPDPFEDISTDYLAGRLVATDTLLLKSAGIRGQRLFDAYEMRLYKALKNTFTRRARAGIDRATRNLGGDETASKGDLARINSRLASAFGGWQNDVAPLVKAVARQSFQNGAQQITQRARGKLGSLRDVEPVAKAGDDDVDVGDAVFDLTDEQAVQAIARNQLYWVGEHYDDDLSERIADVVNETMLGTGMGRSEAGKILRDKLADSLGLTDAAIPEGFAGSTEDYFQLIAANTVSNARVAGSIMTMADLGVERLEIVAVGDERMCPRCGFMDGRTVTVGAASAKLADILSAETPEAAKEAHAWASTLGDMKDADKAGSLTATYTIPPFHGGCRCTTDIAE